MRSSYREGHAEEGSIVVAPIRLPVRRRQPGIVGRIPDHQRLSTHGDGSRQALTHLEPRGRHGLARGAIRACEHQVVAVAYPDTDRVRIEELSARLGHFPEQRLQGLDSRQLAAHVQERLESSAVGRDFTGRLGRRRRRRVGSIKFCRHGFRFPEECRNRKEHAISGAHATG